MPGLPPFWGRDKRERPFMNAIFFGRIIDAASARSEE
jgi:hypothetical protein